MKHKFQDNPIVFKNSKTEALEDANNIFIEILKEYAELNKVEPESIITFKELIEEVYANRKIQYFLEDKLERLTGKVDELVDFALNKETKKNNYTDLFYFKHTNHIISND